MSGGSEPDVDVLQRHLDTRAALDRAVCARVIHQEAAHHVSGDRKEMRAVLPAHAPLIDEPQIRLVHERRRRQRMVGALPPQVAPRQSAHLRIDRLHQAVARRRLPVAPRDEQARHVLGLGHVSSGGMPRYTAVVPRRLLP